MISLEEQFKGKTVGEIFLGRPPPTRTAYYYLSKNDSKWKECEDWEIPRYKRFSYQTKQAVVKARE